MIALAIHAITCLACDYIHFGNRLTRIETLGIVFAAVSIVLLEVGRPPSKLAEPNASGTIAAEPSDEPERTRD
jgi:hypothetical protein